MAIPCFAIGQTRSGIMAGWRRAVELTMTDEEIERLTVLSRSRTEPAIQVSRAQILLAYRGNPSFCAVGKRIGVHHQTVQRCVERALAYGPLRQSRIDHGRAKNRSSRWRPKPGWCRWRATRPRSTAKADSQPTSQKQREWTPSGLAKAHSMPSYPKTKRVAQCCL